MPSQKLDWLNLWSSCHRDKPETALGCDVTVNQSKRRSEISSDYIGLRLGSLQLLIKAEIQTIVQDKQNRPANPVV